MGFITPQVWHNLISILPSAIFRQVCNFQTSNTHTSSHHDGLANSPRPSPHICMHISLQSNWWPLITMKIDSSHGTFCKNCLEHMQHQSRRRDPSSIPTSSTSSNHQTPKVRGWIHTTRTLGSRMAAGNQSLWHRQTSSANGAMVPGLVENTNHDSMGAEKCDSALGRKHCGEDRAKSIHQITNRVETQKAHTTERHPSQSTI